MQEHKKNEYTFLNGNFIYFLNFSESFRELSSTTLHYVPKIVTDLCTMHQHNIIDSSKTENKFHLKLFHTISFYGAHPVKIDNYWQV